MVKDELPGGKARSYSIFKSGKSETKKDKQGYTKAERVIRKNVGGVRRYIIIITQKKGGSKKSIL